MQTTHKLLATLLRKRSSLLALAFCFAIILSLGAQPRAGQAHNGVVAQARVRVARSLGTVRGWLSGPTRAPLTASAAPVMAAFTVTNTNDDNNPGSLRRAINDANATAGQPTLVCRWLAVRRLTRGRLPLARWAR